MLAQDENLAGLEAINRDLIARAESVDSPQRAVLDMDSADAPAYGQQEHSAYNGHFEATCYRPLLLFNCEGDCLAAKLRPGKVHSAEGWEELLLPEIERQQKLDQDVVFRADPAFAKPEIYQALEEHGAKYAIRIPANDSLMWDIEELLTRRAGRPSHKPVVRYKSFLYGAASWRTARRVVAMDFVSVIVVSLSLRSVRPSHEIPGPGAPIENVARKTAGNAIVLPSTPPLLKQLTVRPFMIYALGQSYWPDGFSNFESSMGRSCFTSESRIVKPISGRDT